MTTNDLSPVSASTTVTKLALGILRLVTIKSSPSTSLALPNNAASVMVNAVSSVALNAKGLSTSITTASLAACTSIESVCVVDDVSPLLASTLTAVTSSGNSPLKSSGGVIVRLLRSQSSTSTALLSNVATNSLLPSLKIAPSGISSTVNDCIDSEPSVSTRAASMFTAMTVSSYTPNGSDTVITSSTAPPPLCEGESSSSLGLSDVAVSV